jgi:hypothetical protein
MVDEAKLNELLGRMVGDLGAAATVALVRLGDSLGLYKALAKGPLTPPGLAAATGIAERYAREWLSAQAAADYVTYDKATGTFTQGRLYTHTAGHRNTVQHDTGSTALTGEAASPTERCQRALPGPANLGVDRPDRRPSGGRPKWVYGHAASAQ